MSKGPNYKLCQMFGYKGQGQKVQEEDLISVIKFDNTGELLAVGDHAGRIIVFDTSKKPKKKQDIFEYYAEFQAHNKEFDCLRSQEVDQTVKDMCWFNSQGKYHKLLTSNVKTIKFWKVFEKTEKRAVKSLGSDLKIPTLEKVDSSFIANVQTTFPSKHHADIQTLSKSHNEQYLLSFDEVQGLLWNMNRPDVPYIAVDYLKGKEVEDVQENVTSGKFHPSSDSMFVYTTNKKTVKMNDMRVSTREEAGVNFTSESKQTKNFFTQLISSYSSVQFLRGGKYIAARDYLTVKVWDVCQSKKPVCQVVLQQNYKQKLCEMFQNENIYDKFPVAGSSDGCQILTGNYNNNFHTIDLLDGSNTQYELNYKKQTVVKQMGVGKTAQLTKMDYDRKTVAMDFNMKKNMFAVGSLNTFFIYSSG